MTEIVTVELDEPTDRERRRNQRIRELLNKEEPLTPEEAKRRERVFDRLPSARRLKGLTITAGELRRYFATESERLSAVESVMYADILRKARGDFPETTVVDVKKVALAEVINMMFVPASANR